MMDENKEENDIVIKVVYEDKVNDEMKGEDEKDEIVKIKIVNK